MTSSDNYFAYAATYDNFGDAEADLVAFREIASTGVMGFRQFSLRGLKKVQGEWSLVCLALNLRRLHVLMGVV